MSLGTLILLACGIGLLLFFLVDPMVRLPNDFRAMRITIGDLLVLSALLPPAFVLAGYLIEQLVPWRRARKGISAPRNLLP